MDKNVAERPMRKYRVKGTYVVNYEVTVPAAGIYDAEEQAERAVQDGDDEERERDKIHVDEIEEVDGEVYCPNCDQLLRLEE